MTTAPRAHHANLTPLVEQVSPDLPAVFAAQQAHRWTLAATGPEQRRRTLARFAEAVRQRRIQLAEALRRDLGKSRAEAEITEIYALLEEVKFARQRLAGWMRPKAVPTPVSLSGLRGAVQAEPRGVCLILSPWNYPVNLSLVPLVAAIAAGNTVVLKPSEKAPHTAEAMRELIAATFDPREVAVVTGDAGVARALLDLPFDHIFYTGGARIGREVMAAAARHLSSVTLELGGKSPAIVHDSADLDLTAERIIWGKLLNAGQTCVAPDHVLLPEHLRDRFVERLGDLIHKRFGGETWQRKGPDYGRMVDAAGVERLERLTRDSVAQGAQVALGGTFDRAARFVSPTVLTHVRPDMPVMQEELFGPVLPVVTYQSFDEALALVRGGDKPLALYLFAQDPAVAEQVRRATSSGSLVVNGTVVQLSNPHLPFGGVGASGMGSYHGEHGFRAFSHERAIMVEPKMSPVRMIYPPYGRAAPRFIAWVMRQMNR